MRRTSSQELILNTEERAWLQGRFAREAFKINGLTPKEQKERLPQKILAIKKKLDDPGHTTISVDRNDLKILEQQTANYITLMRTKTLPEYEKRCAQGPEAEKHYGKYRAEETARVEMLEGLLGQIERMLEK